MKGSSTGTLALVAAGSAAYAAPLALCRYYPGLDMPFHALAVAAVRAGDAAAVEHQFSGALTLAPGGWSYRTLYVLGDWLAGLVGDPAIALQILIGLYALGFALAAASLLRSFGSHPALALLAAPAAHSAVMAYGFFAQAIAYPLVLWLWATVRRALAEPHLSRARAVRRVALAATLALLIAVTHPLAAGLAAFGALVLVLAHLSRERLLRAGAVAIAISLGVVPAALAVARLGAGAESFERLPPLLRDASLWDRWSAQPWVPLSDSIGRAPERLFGLAPEGGQLWLLGLTAVGAALMLLAGGRAARDADTWPSRHAAELLLAALLVLYLLAPFDLEAPLVIAVQPRLLPLVWVALLCTLRPRAQPVRRWAPLACAVPAAVGVTMAVLSMRDFASESDDFRRAAASVPPGARTLALVEHPPIAERTPASPWRHLAVYLMAERGGLVSHPFFDGGARGSWLPVQRRADASLPKAPRLGQPRTFRWERHGADWDYFLIRDEDPAAAHDYFAEADGAVELAVRSGRWRLYRRSSSAARARSEAASAGSP